MMVLKMMIIMMVILIMMMVILMMIIMVMMMMLMVMVIMMIMMMMMQDTVRHQMRSLAGDLHRGDVILANHPRAGGSHLPDLTVITPVFYERHAEPVKMSQPNILILNHFVDF